MLIKVAYIEHIDKTRQNNDILFYFSDAPILVFRFQCDLQHSLVSTTDEKQNSASFSITKNVIIHIISREL